MIHGMPHRGICHHVLHLLGMIAHQQGKHASADAMIGDVIAIKSAEATYRSNLGNVPRADGKLGLETCFCPTDVRLGKKPEGNFQIDIQGENYRGFIFN